MHKQKLIVLVEATAEKETLESLEKTGRFIGLFGSFSKGDEIPAWMRRIEGAEIYPRTKLKVLDLAGKVESVLARLDRFERTPGARALLRIKNKLGDRASFSASLALFYVCGSGKVTIPMNFLKLCAEIGIAVSFVVYTDSPEDHDSKNAASGSLKGARKQSAATTSRTSKATNQRKVIWHEVTPHANEDVQNPKTELLRESSSDPAPNAKPRRTPWHGGRVT